MEPIEDTRGGHDRVTSSEDEVQDVSFDGTSVESMAWMFMARSHHRETVLQQTFLTWRQKRDDAARRRRRLDITAASFFDHRLSFVTFRAWQWAYEQRVLALQRNHGADAFRGVWATKLCWLAWTRYRRQAQARRALMAALERRNDMRVAYCGQRYDACRRQLLSSTALPEGGGETTTVLSPLPSTASRRCCRWHQWVRLARRCFALRTTTARTQSAIQRRALAVWGVVALHVRAPQTLRRAQMTRRSALISMAMAFLAWRTSTGLQRLHRWHDAETKLRAWVSSATANRFSKCFHQWRHAATTALVTRRVACATLRQQLRVWLRWVVQRRYIRHAEAAADRRCVAAMQRFAWHRWASVFAARAMWHRDAATATAHAEALSRRRCLTVWQGAARRIRTQRAHLAGIDDLRKQLLVVIGVRRLADAAQRGQTSRGGFGTPRPVDGGHGHHHASPPSSYVFSSTTLLRPIPLLRLPSQPEEAPAHVAVLHRSPPMSMGLHTTPQRRFPSPTPMAVPRSCNSTPADRRTDDHRFESDSSILKHGWGEHQRSLPEAREAQIRHLLQQYSTLRSTARHDRMDFAQLASERDALKRSMALHHQGRPSYCVDKSGVAPSTADDAPPPADAHRLIDVEVRLRALRERIETRESIRSQIVMLQRELRAYLQHDGGGTTTSSGLGGLSDYAAAGGGLLATPRSASTSSYTGA